MNWLLKITKNVVGCYVETYPKLVHNFPLLCHTCKTNQTPSNIHLNLLIRL